MKRYLPIISFIVLCWVLGITALCHASETAIRTIAYESSNQSLPAQIMVAEVIKNRMSARNLTAEEVCLQPHQFSCFKNGKPTQKRTLTENELEKARIAWSQSHEDATGATLYHDTSVTPYWAKKCVKIAEIDDLIFYKEAR